MTSPEELRDRLLLVFTELAGYGIATREGGCGSAALVAAELTAALHDRFPNALGSFVFWLRADEEAFARGTLPALHTSGPDVERALAAALRRQGLGVALR